MMGVGAAMGGQVGKEWFEVMYGNNPDLAKAEFEKYRAKASASKGTS